MTGTRGDREAADQARLDCKTNVPERTGATVADEFLQERRSGLEEEFFARENRKLLERLRETQGGQDLKASLREASGISDEVVLDRFVEMGLSPETVAALTLAPLVQVAWSDGTLDSKEREVILASARERPELADGAQGHGLLEGWLNQRPGEHLFEAWQGYAKALMEGMDEDTKRRVREDLIQRVRNVAEAAGGTLGMGRTSGAERDAIAKIDEVLR